MTNLRLPFFLLFVLFIVAGCGEDDPTGPGDDNNLPSRTFEVEWKEGVVYIDSTQLGSIASLDTAEYRYHFNQGSTVATSLQIGSIIVVHGQAIRRVINIVSSGSTLIVETEDAYLTDAINNGKVGWNFTPEF